MAKRKQKQTLKEFKAWLQGVEELQPDKWCPNQEQWVLIRARIDGIKEDKPLIEKEAVPVNPFYTGPVNVPMNLGNPTAAPMNFNAPPTPGGVPNVQNIEMTAAAKAMLDPVAGEKGKTPHSDASSGPIESSFS